jgi:hypothetical protein
LKNAPKYWNDILHKQFKFKAIINMWPPGDNIITKTIEKEFTHKLYLDNNK